MAYLIANLTGWVIWFFFFVERPDLRKEMIIMGILTTPMSFIDLYIVPEYWIPQTVFDFPGGIEGIMFFFQAGGVSAVSYEFIKKKSLVRIGKYHRPVVSILIMSLLFPLLVLFGLRTGINPILVLIALGAVVLLILINARKDLLESAMIGGITFGSIYFASLFIWFLMFPSARDWFTLVGIPKVFVLGVPLYEIILGFITGAYWGNLYEFLFGYRYRLKE